MKNYFFNPNDWGSNWTVLAPSAKEALELIKQDMEDAKDYFREEWATATIDNLPDDYTIDEYEVGEVIRGSSS